VRCFFRAARFGSDELRPQLVRKPRDDLVLRIEEVS
jgi:hypothetical protein